MVFKFLNIMVFVLWGELTGSKLIAPRYDKAGTRVLIPYP